ncbi:unnamed protein product, partial [Ectocarpus fasciculatus]
MLVAVLALFVVLVRYTDGIPFSTENAQRSNSTYMSVDAWDALTLTVISWTLQGRVFVFFDGVATDVLRFGAGNESLSSSSSSSSSSQGGDQTYPVFLPDDLGAGSDICNLTAYVVDPVDPFNNEEVFKGATVELQNFSTWWYTSTLGQDPNEASNMSASDSGNASLLLGDPGVYFACLVSDEETCIAADCVEFVVYQPNYDFFQVSSTNIGAIVTIHFNVASSNANSGDWGWVLRGTDPTFTVQDANDLIQDFGSSEVYARFSEGCWFYLGAAAVLDRPFLCSRDPDTELAALQASTLNREYQYGSIEFYSTASGNVSIWYAVDEDYNFAMVHNYRTCGIEILPPESLVVNATSELIVVAEPEQGEHCDVGGGIPLEISSLPVTTSYVDIPASIFFQGSMKNMTSMYTSLSISLPVTGAHFVVVLLESGGTLGTLEIMSIAGEPYAPNSVVSSKPPTSMVAHSSANVSFSCRDFYSNDITFGYGDDAFQAWMSTSSSQQVQERVSDVGNGSYVVELSTRNESETTLFFVQRDKLNIPGSPFEVYILGPDQCVIESLEINVGECTTNLHRTVVHEWKDGITCEGGLALPGDARVSCGFIPTRTSLGRTMMGFSAFGAIYAIFFLVWIMKHRETSVVKMGQPFVCQLFLFGCIALNLTAPLYLGEPSTLICRLRPCVLHTALTFASRWDPSTYRVHRLFNNETLARMSISDRSLVMWVLRLVAVDVMLLTLWLILDGPRARTVHFTQGYADLEKPVCDPGAAYVSTILWIYKGGLNLFGVVMAAKTWHCADGVGESQSICMSVYNTTLLGLLNVVMYLLVSDNPMARSCVRSFSAVWGTVFTISAVFGPKAFKLYLHGDIQDGQGGRRRSDVGSTLEQTRRDSYATATTTTNNVARLSLSFLNPRSAIPQHGLLSRRSSEWYRVPRGSQVLPEKNDSPANAVSTTTPGRSKTPATAGTLETPRTVKTKSSSGQRTRLPPLT